MKGLTKELKQSSVDKWVEIEGNIKLKSAMSYLTYWNPCGFCRAIKTRKHIPDCSECSLHEKINKMVICNFFVNEESHAHLALVLAGERKFKKALPHCRIVLKAIRSTRIDKGAK